VNQTTATVDQGGTRDEYSFEVAGVGIRLRSKGMLFRYDARREVFAEVADKPEIDLRVSMEVLDSAPAGRLVFDSGMVWRLFEDNGEHVFRFSSPAIGPIPYKELRVSMDGEHGEIILHEPYHRGRAVDPLEYPLDELLVVNRLGRRLGCELHACGIVDENGLGWIFCGHSGAGKSTLAHLWADRPVTVLSDDRIILRVMDGSVRMYGTPWHGEAGFSVARDAALAGILILEHATENRIVPLDMLDAVSELMARAFLPFHDAVALDTAMDTLTAATERVPCGRFGFTPERSAIDCIEEWMMGAHRA